MFINSFETRSIDNRIINFIAGDDCTESIGRHCRFSNCKHLTEPKCAVKQAVLDGIIDQKVLDRYHYNVQKLELLTKRRKSWRF